MIVMLRRFSSEIPGNDSSAFLIASSFVIVVPRCLVNHFLPPEMRKGRKFVRNFLPASRLDAQ